MIKCSICGSKENIQQHHLTYKYKKNNPTTPLCKGCHQRLHYRRRERYQCPIDAEHYVGFDCNECWVLSCIRYPIPKTGYIMERKKRYHDKGRMIQNNLIV